MRRVCLFERASDFPMMTEGIDDASDAPAVLITDRKDLFRSGLDSTCKDGIGVGDRHDDTHRNSAERFGTEVVMLGRLIAEPEFCAIDRKPGDDAATGVKAK